MKDLGAEADPVGDDKGLKYMDSVTSLILSEIKKQYGSRKEFCKVSGIPYSTVSSALTKGVGGTSYDTVVKMCKLLKIRQSEDAGLVLLNEEFYEFYRKLSSLDEQGLHTVGTVLNMEYNRCVDAGTAPVVRAFNNIGLAIGGSD